MLNRLFFASCLSLSIWAFCFSIANSAQDYESALFWRRLTSFGWGTVYSILVHFFLVLTERKKILKNKWLYVLLYLPAAVNVFAFGLSDTARGQYQLINTTMGWINVSANTWGDLYFNLYYVSFTIMGLWLLWNWGKKSKDPVKKKQAYLFMTSYATAMILGTMTDIIVNTYTSFQIPQIAPVIVLLPTTAIFYAIKRYGLMALENSNLAEPGKILSEGNMEKFVQIMSLVYIIGGMLNFATQYFLNPDPPRLNSILFFSLFFFIIGIALHIIELLPIKVNVKDGFFILIMLVSILLIALKFIESASITVWAAPFIIIILSVLFNKRLMIFWIGIFILITQIYIWVKIPTAMVRVDGSDYLARIGILSITLWLAYFINRVYIQRLEENEAQIRFQKIVSQISTDFVKVSEDNLDTKINALLQLTGEYFKVERTFFMGMSHQKNYEWYNEDIESAINMLTDVNSHSFSWWVNQMISNDDVINIPDVEMLPQEAVEEKAILKHHKIKSLLCIPVTNKGKNLGLLFFASVKEVKIWKGNYQELLTILANLLSDALVKVEAEKEINYMAYYDALTGLPNRTLFKNRLKQGIYLASRTEKYIGVIYMDIDSFKSVNDSIGHFGGDEVLKEVACRLSECLRKHDTVSRFSGDEFLIQITQMAKEEDIRKIADKIINLFEKPITVGEQEFFITASLGISIFPTDGEDAEVLIKNADLAMYVSKDKGKNQYTFCSPDMKEDVLEKMKLTNSLYRALERNELLVYYQPQVSVSTKKIIGFEALLRWNNPEFGMISPTIFIPLAEQTGLINPIGQWVLKTACRQNKQWQLMGLPLLRMAVNLSIEQFRDRNLTTIVSRTLSEIGLEAKYLQLEITESTASNGTDNIIPVLNELKKLGVSIAIDDFGTEYSSLSRLKTLPIDQIKIDIQFIRGISESTKDEAIAKTIIQLAKNLNLNVIAEGVENEQQFEFLKKEMCDEIQGFFFYKPMPASEIEAIFSSKVKITIE